MLCACVFHFYFWPLLTRHKWWQCILSHAPLILKINSWSHNPSSKPGIFAHIVTFVQVFLGEFHQQHLHLMARNLSVYLVRDVALRRPSLCHFATAFMVRWCLSMIPLPLGLYTDLKYRLTPHFSYSSLKTSEWKPTPLSNSTSSTGPLYFTVPVLILHHIATLPSPQSIIDRYSSWQ